MKKKRFVSVSRIKLFHVLLHTVTVKNDDTAHTSYVVSVTNAARIGLNVNHLFSFFFYLLHPRCYRHYPSYSTTVGPFISLAIYKHFSM